MLSGFTVTAALLSLPVTVPDVPAAVLPVSVPEVPVAFPSVSVPLIPLVCIKFIVANFAADIAVNDLISNDLISVSALPCVFGADCEVVAASVELLAVAFLLALLC